jgi:hypothetical protein
VDLIMHGFGGYGEHQTSVIMAFLEERDHLHKYALSELRL